MNFKNVLRGLMQTNGTNARALSVDMGKHFNFISNICGRQSCRTETLCEIADALGYEVVLRPKRSPSKRARHPEEFVLEYVDPNDPMPEPVLDDDDDDEEEDDDE